MGAQALPFQRIFILKWIPTNVIIMTHLLSHMFFFFFFQTEPLIFPCSHGEINSLFCILNFSTSTPAATIPKCLLFSLFLSLDMNIREILSSLTHELHVDFFYGIFFFNKCFELCFLEGRASVQLNIEMWLAHTHTQWMYISVSYIQ